MVVQTATSSNNVYSLLFAGSTTSSTNTEGARKSTSLTYNPSTKALVTGGTIDGYTLAAACAKDVDSSSIADDSVNLPTSAVVYDFVTTGLATKQNVLISGTNIKTIDNVSLLGAGNINLSTTYHPYRGSGSLDFSASAITVASNLTVGNGHMGTSSSLEDGYRKIMFGSSGHYIELKNYGTYANPQFGFHFSDMVVSDGAVSAAGLSSGGSSPSGGGIEHVLLSESE